MAVHAEGPIFRGALDLWPPLSPFLAVAAVASLLAARPLIDRPALVMLAICGHLGLKDPPRQCHTGRDLQERAYRWVSEGGL